MLNAKRGKNVSNEDPKLVVPAAKGTILFFS